MRGAADRKRLSRNCHADGGTGKYAGIRGSGTFTLTNVTDRVMWDVLEWEYEVP